LIDTAEDGLPLPQRYWAIVTLAIGMAVSVLDSSIANIALPTIARQIGASPAQSIWVINAYQLAVVVAGQQDRSDFRIGDVEPAQQAEVGQVAASDQHHMGRS
jgi:hypothetical protein